jgi:hypothetical protein
MCLSAFPCPSTSCSSSRMQCIVCCSNCLLLSKASLTLNVANCLLWQLSVPAASTLLMRLLTQCARCCFLVAIFDHLLSTQKSASHYLEQPPQLLPWYGLFFSHFPISSLLDPSRRRKAVLHVCVTGLPILHWSRSSKHFLPHSLSSSKLPLFDASVPFLDSCSHC